MRASERPVFGHGATKLETGSRWRSVFPVAERTATSCDSDDCPLGASDSVGLAAEMGNIAGQRHSANSPIPAALNVCLSRPIMLNTQSTAFSWGVLFT